MNTIHSDLLTFELDEDIFTGKPEIIIVSKLETLIKFDSDEKHSVKYYEDGVFFIKFEVTDKINFSYNAWVDPKISESINVVDTERDYRDYAYKTVPVPDYIRESYVKHELTLSLTTVARLLNWVKIDMIADPNVCSVENLRSRNTMVSYYHPKCGNSILLGKTTIDDKHNSTIVAFSHPSTIVDKDLNRYLDNILYTHEFLNIHLFTADLQKYYCDADKFIREIDDEDIIKEVENRRHSIYLSIYKNDNPIYIEKFYFHKIIDYSDAFKCIKNDKFYYNAIDSDIDFLEFIKQIDTDGVKLIKFDQSYFGLFYFEYAHLNTKYSVILTYYGSSKSRMSFLQRLNSLKAFLDRLKTHEWSTPESNFKDF